MPHTVRLVAKQRLSEGALAEQLERRRRYTADGDAFRYLNPETGVTFAVRREDDGRALALVVEVPRAPFFGVEAEMEASALALELDLEAPEHGPADAAVDSAEAFVHAYARDNAEAHAALLDAATEPHELATSDLMGLWRWNLQRAALEASFGGGVEVPRVAVAVHPDTGRTCTLASLSGARPALLPDVDLLVFGAGWVPTRELSESLDAIGVRSPRFRYRLDEGLREAGVRHYDLSRDADAVVSLGSSLRDGGEPPRVVPMTEVFARELTRLAMGLGDSSKHLEAPPDPAARFPRECRGFTKTRTFELARVLGGYTWLSPWKLEAIAYAKQRRVVAGVGAGGVVFFDVETGKRLREVRGDVYAGTSIGVSDDAATLAVGNELGAVDVFDVDLEGHGPTLQKRSTFAAATSEGVAPPHGQVLGVAPDGSVVIGGVGDEIVVLRDGEEHTLFRAAGPVCASGDLARVWTGATLVDVTTEQVQSDLGIDPKTPRAPALSPDGRHLVFATMKGELVVVRMADGAIVAMVARKDARGQPSVARFLAFTPDGARLVVGDSLGLEIRKAPSLELERSFDTPAWDAAVSDEAIYRVVGDRIWTQPLEGPAPPVNDGPINQLFHSARGPIALATSTPGEGMTGGRAVLWHVATGAVLRATARLCPDRVNLTRDGRHLCLATETALVVLDVGTLAEVTVVEPLGTEKYVRPIDLDASPDGKTVLASLEDGHDRMVSLETGLDVWRADLGIRCATFNADGSKIVAGDQSRLRVIDAATGAVEKSVGVDDPRPDGEHVLLGDGSRAVRVAIDQGIALVDLAAETTEIVAFPRARDVVAVSPDSRVVGVLVDGDAGAELVLWSVETREEVDRLSLASAEDAPVSAAFSPDGKTLLVGTSRGALLVFSSLA